ncbi:2-hydroxyacid dehydrogenase [Aneurinibacillus terranovensis]|uniref:2-hydroxyacid dehydrogenase n=1 Tax=Aneurinibacillus terranovensis TaxID=278991 RepID=UPI000402DAD0|nr:D-glycerate dehydrogenase [Aneurinibacillus terranovensis]
MEKKPKVYVTRKLPEEIIENLHSVCDMKMWEKEDEPVPREILEKEITDTEGLLCLLTDSVDQNLLENGNKLKVISNMAVGYNNIDVDAATKRRIVVTNTPDVLTESTADLTFGLLIAAARRFGEASDYLKKGRWKTWSPMLLTGQDIHHATLGIIGLGNIGQAIARRAKGFNMNILYYNRRRRLDIEEELGIQYCEFENLLRVSDFVVIMVPYNNETKNLISTYELSLMKPTTVLINTARGGIVNEQALYEALIEKRIWAAGLDVFEMEPVPPGHPLLRLDNVLALPHIASASINTRMNMAKLAARNLMDVFQGRVPPNPVNLK